MDFVILWVDNTDPKWIEEFHKYQYKETGITDKCRFRDWDNLKFWFRGVEQYAKWVNKIFFITNGQVPSWLNTKHPQIRLVKHDEYIPKNYLPTFSSNTIEMFLHNIPDLGEEFVLFNDDFFIIDKINPERFFKNNLPCDMSAFDVYPGYGLSTNNMCNLEIINKYFNKNECIRKHPFKWFNYHNGINQFRTFLLVWWPYFVGFLDPHLPQPFLKDVFKEIWDKEGVTIGNSLIPKFRQKTNITQYLVRYWQLASGKFCNINPLNDSICFHLNSKNVMKASEYIQNQKKRIIVLNDNEYTDFDYCKPIINNAFQALLPNKSTFEL